MSEPLRSNQDILEKPNEFRAALARARTAIGEIEGVISVGIGQKATGNAYRDDIAIVVFVREKRKLDTLPSAQRIPSQFEGYRTDVVVVGKGEVLACENETEYEVMRGGIQITPFVRSSAGYGVGTLGCIVHRRSDISRDNVYLLTCRHVLYSTDNREGDYVYHPFPPRTSGNLSPGPSRALGPIQAAPPIANVGFRTPGGTVEQFFVDAATARIDIDSKCWGTRCTKDKIRFETTIVDLELGTESTIADVRSVIDDPSIIGRRVFKVGRTTGRTVGIVRRVDAPLPLAEDPDVPAPPGGLTARGLIEIDFDTTVGDGRNCKHNVAFAEKGDSGSLLLDEDRRAIGLVALRGPATGIAPIVRAAYACHIMPVLDNLRICIPTPSSIARGSCGAMDGTGKTPVRPAQADLPEPDGEMHLSRRAAAEERPPFLEPVAISDEERDRMFVLLDRLRSTEYGVELHETFGEIRREIGYLVRNVRPVMVAWHRQRGPAFLAHVLKHLKGETDKMPREIEGVSREALLTRMAELLAAHGSRPLRAAIERHRPVLLTVLANADTVHDCLDALPAEVTA